MYISMDIILVCSSTFRHIFRHIFFDDYSNIFRHIFRYIPTYIYIFRHILRYILEYLGFSKISVSFCSWFVLASDRIIDGQIRTEGVRESRSCGRRSHRIYSNGGGFRWTKEGGCQVSCSSNLGLNWAEYDVWISPHFTKVVGLCSIFSNFIFHVWCCSG